MDIDVVMNLETDIEETETIEVDVINSGPQGLSAYQIYQKNGGELSELAWLESLKGPPGLQGQDGYTPVRGIDYWNEEDIVQIKEYCNSLITGALGGSY